MTIENFHFCNILILCTLQIFTLDRKIIKKLKIIAGFSQHKIPESYIKLELKRLERFL